MAETKQKPTPGPFDVRAHSHGAEVRGPLGIGVGRFGCSTTAGIDGSYNITAEEAAANARMFAAAGDLLEALREVIGVWTTVCLSRGGDPDHYAQIIAARAAIARAEGEQ